MRPARKLLLRHGFAVTLEFCRLVQALEPPAPVRCIIAVNDTNGTFRRAALAQLHGDADGTTAFAPQALAKAGEGVWMLDLDREDATGYGRVAARPGRRG